MRIANILVTKARAFVRTHPRYESGTVNERRALSYSFIHLNKRNTLRPLLIESSNKCHGALIAKENNVYNNESMTETSAAVSAQYQTDHTKPIISNFPQALL